jgi:hypothetical protein
MAETVPAGCNVRCLACLEGETGGGQDDSDPPACIIAAGYHDGHLRLWDTGGRLRIDVPAHTAPVEGLHAFLDPQGGGPRLASGGGDGLVRLYDESGALLRTMQVGRGAYVRALLTYPTAEGLRLAVGDSVGEVLIVDPGVGEGARDPVLHRLMTPRWGALARPIAAMAAYLPDLGPCSACVVVAHVGDPVVEIFDGVTGRLRRRVQVSGRPVAGAGKPDVRALMTYADPVSGRHRIVTGEKEGSVQVFDAETGAAMHTLAGRPAIPGWVVSLAPYVTVKGHIRVVVGTTVGVSVIDPEAGRHVFPVAVEGVANGGACLVAHVFETAEGRVGLATGWSMMPGVAFWDLGEALARGGGLRPANKSG